MYTLESLKPLNAVFDSIHRLEQDDVEMVNNYVMLIESTRSEKPCSGDIIEYTDEYGHYNQSAHIHGFDAVTRRVGFYTFPFGPFVFHDDEQGFRFESIPGSHASVDFASLTYVGKREKSFKAFGHCFLPAHSAIYFYALVNVWEYIAPNQEHPGYSTKDWGKQYITYVEKPEDGSGYHYYGNFNSGLVFKNAAELQRWKATYKAVEFPGGSPNQIVLFHYRENDKLVSREEWDALDLPMDTRFVNGIIHVKVSYDDNAHMITVYRFTNSGYLDKWFGEYERAKGTVLVPPRSEIK